MRKAIFFFLVLALATFIGLQLNKDPGYVLISLGHWTLETPLWFALIATIVLFSLLHLLLWLINTFTSLHSRWFRFLSRRSIRLSHNRTRRGLIEFSEGNWQQAEQHLIKALPNSDVPLINYLAAARAAQEQNHYKRRDQYLREAQKSMPEAKIAIELTQAQLQITNAQWEQALATLKHLHAMVPKHPYVLKLLMKLYLELKDHQHLNDLLPQIRRLGILKKHEQEAFEKQLFHGLLLMNSKKAKAEPLLHCWQQIPKTLKTDIDLMTIYAKGLLDNKEHQLAEIFLKKALKKQWSDKLINLYGLCQIKDTNKQLRFAESFLKQHAQNASLLLTLGRLCLKAQLWGKAKAYLEQCTSLSASPHAYDLLAKLLERLDEPELAQACYKKGLEAAVN